MGMGTPQFLCLDTHQSGLFLIIASSLALPQDGKNEVADTAEFARSRNDFLSLFL